MHHLRPLPWALILLPLLLGAPAAVQGQVHTNSLGCGSPGNPCVPKVSLSINSFDAGAVRGPDAGPYTYTMIVSNNSTVGGWFEIDCGFTAQLICLHPSPNNFWLDGDADSVVTVGFSTLGLGTFTQTYTGHASANGDIYTDTQIATTAPFQVTGQSFIIPVTPVNHGMALSGDSLAAMIHYSGGVSTSSFKIFFNGVDKSSWITTRTSTALVAKPTGVAAGPATWTTYGCTLSGRCDTVSVSYQVQGPPTVFALDDSLPVDSLTDTLATPMLGPLALPPSGLRGCPQSPGYPEVRLTSPLSYMAQPAPGDPTNSLTDIIYLAGANSGAVNIATLTVANAITDTAHQCSHWTFDDYADYNFAFWGTTDIHDTLWVHYPWTDKPVWALGPAAPVDPLTFLPTELAFDPAPRAHGPFVPPDPFPARGFLIDRLWRPFLPPPKARGFGRRLSAPARSPFILGAGPIDTMSLIVTLNGDTVVKNSVATRGTVHVVSLQRPAQDVQVDVGDPALRFYSNTSPSSDSGGWNEVTASIADTVYHHRTTVRARWVQLGTASTAPLALGTLRDFRHESAADCAAFGAFQCGGVFLTQTIPGFVTRDKDRSLHLVYRSASQAQRLPVPLSVRISRLQRMPDSLDVYATVDGARTGDTLRYAGIVGEPGCIGCAPLNQGQNELRALSAEVPAVGRDTLRRAVVNVVSHYGPSVSTDTIGQDIVQLYLSDTTATRFGAGWQLAELSRLVLLTPHAGAAAALLLSGDGSYVVFRRSGSNWIAPPGELARLVDGLSGLHTVYLPGGASIGFNARGWQLWTQDLVGNRTSYHWGGGSDSTRLLSISDTTGYTYTFAYNGHNGSGEIGDITVTPPAGAGSTVKVATLAYDASHRLSNVKIWRSGTAGDSTKFGYDSTAPSAAFLTKVTDPRGGSRISTFTYDTVTRTPVQLLRPDGQPVSFRGPWRRAAPRLGWGRGHAQPLERLVYLGQVRGTSIAPGEPPMDYIVDPFGAPTWVRTIAPAVPLTFPPAPVVDLTRRIDRDTLGRVTKIVNVPDQFDLADSVVYAYDALNRVTRLIRNTAAYPIPDSSHALDTLRFTYDTVNLSGGGTGAGPWCSRLLTSTDPMGGVTTVVYGGSGAASCLPVKTIGLAHDTTTFAYGALTAGDSNGTRPISIRDPNGLTTAVAYGPKAAGWNTAKLTAPGGAVTQMGYDSLGRPKTSTDPLGVVATICRDLSGRVTRQRTGSDSLSPAVQSTYDAAGHVTQTDVFRPGSGALCTASQTGTVQTTRTYLNLMDETDSLTGPGTRSGSVKQGRKQSWKLFDGAGRPTWDLTGNGTYRIRLYDWLGHVSDLYQSAVTPKGVSVDGEPFADSATAAEYGNGTTFNLIQGDNLSDGEEYQYSYDRLGRRMLEVGFEPFLNGVTPTVQRSWDYSRTSQVIDDKTIFTDGLTQVRHYRYNRRGQRTQVADTLSVAGGSTLDGDATGLTRYVYNGSTGRLDSLVATAGTNTLAKIGYVYDAGGRELRHQLALGSAGTLLTDTTTYDATGRLATRTTTGPGGAHTWYHYSGSYDPTGRLRSLSDSRLSGSGSTYATLGSSQGFTYDTLGGTGRLLVSRRTLDLTTRTDVYGYDLFGNRTTSLYTTTDGGNCQGLTTTSTYDADNRLKGLASICPDSERILTDQAGNRLGDVANENDTIPLYHIQKMSYTAANQLYFAETSTSTAVTSYDVNWHWYDGEGLRIMSQHTTGSSWQVPFSATSGLRAYYLYDGSDVGLVVERSLGGQAFSVRSRYVTGGLDAQWAGRVRTPSGSRVNLALVPDYQGSTVAAVYEGDTLSASANYCDRDAYGAITPGLCGTASGVNTETGYGGASTPNTNGGFVYLRNRWYDPQNGRFLTQDPIGLQGGVNLYAYAGNNPVGFSDPFGLCPDPNDPKCLEKQSVEGQATAAFNNAVQSTINTAMGIASALGGAAQGVVNWVGKEIATNTAIAALPVIGEVTGAGRVVVAVSEVAGKFLTESNHLRAVAAGHDFASAGLTADAIVTEIATNVEWETARTGVRYSMQMGEHTVGYSFGTSTKTPGEMIVNAWLDTTK